MSVVIGIFGESCVGKTSVAKALARLLGAEVRHCGEVVKARAAELGIGFQELPPNEHDLIDRETRKLAKSADGNLIIDGRFLDSVLKNSGHVVLFLLECSAAERLRRSKKRKEAHCTQHLHNAPVDTGEVLHRGKRRKKGCIAISTDGLTVNQVAQEILKHLGRFPHVTIE